ncbi:MAG TPA: hypothetical protein VD763_04935 [Candidatus Saccharimonadales bacterium]|nr:hypothetical protein [Candidatus Saccharimonadales bacterium]
MTSATKTGRRRSGVEIFGMVGLVLCLLLAIAIIIGRSWVADQVDGVFDSVDDAVGRGTMVVAQTTGRLEERVADLDVLLTDATAAAGAVTVPPAIAERAAGIADRFGAIRDGWVAVRARIDAALATLAQIDRAIPFVDLPDGPTEELAALDQRITEIGQTVERLRGDARANVQGVVDGATALRGAVARVSEVGVRLGVGLAAVQDRIDRARDNVSLVLLLTTGGLLFLVGYVALLNGLLVRTGRRARLQARAAAANAAIATSAVVSSPLAGATPAPSATAAATPAPTHDPATSLPSDPVDPDVT